MGDVAQSDLLSRRDLDHLGARYEVGLDVAPAPGSGAAQGQPQGGRGQGRTEAAEPARPGRDGEEETEEGSEERNHGMTFGWAESGRACPLGMYC